MNDVLAHARGEDPVDQAQQGKGGRQAVIAQDAVDPCTTGANKTQIDVAGHFARGGHEGEALDPVRTEMGQIVLNYHCT